MDWFKQTFGSSPGGSAAAAAAASADPMAEYLAHWKTVKPFLAKDSNGQGVQLIQQVEDFFFKYQPLIEQADRVLSAPGKILGADADTVIGEINLALAQYSEILKLEGRLRDEPSIKMFAEFRKNRLYEMKFELSTRQTTLEKRKVKPAYIQDYVPPVPSANSLEQQLNQLKKQGKPPGTGGRRKTRSKRQHKKTYSKRQHRKTRR
jgi:hypothetical protein